MSAKLCFLSFPKNNWYGLLRICKGGGIRDRHNTLPVHQFLEIVHDTDVLICTPEANVRIKTSAVFRFPLGAAVLPGFSLGTLAFVTAYQ
jgi:hypothetical protein